MKTPEQYIEEFSEKFAYKKVTGIDHHKMLEHIKEYGEAVREEVRYKCMDDIEDCRQEHNVARHGEDYETAYDRSVDCINPALTPKKDCKHCGQCLDTVKESTDYHNDALCID